MTVSIALLALKKMLKGIYGHLLNYFTNSWIINTIIHAVIANSTSTNILLIFTPFLCADRTKQITYSASSATY
jgi:hypothetical protein